MGVAYIGKAIKLENFAFSVFGKFAEKKYADPGIVTKVCKSYKIYIFWASKTMCRDNTMDLCFI